MSIEAYRQAAQALTSFDLWRKRGGARSFQIEVRLCADTRLEGASYPDWTPHLGAGAWIGEAARSAMRDHLDAYRAHLVERCRRAHIAAANEARSIIAETPPK